MTFRLPTAAEVGELLRVLVPELPRLEGADSTPALADVIPCYGAVCVDDDNHPRCAILADLNATIFLGGKLMMLPDEELAQQIVSGCADAEVVEGFSEIVNNLTVPLNRVETNPHIRSQVAGEWDWLAASPTSEWLMSSDQRTDIEGTFLPVPSLGDGATGAPGRLIFIATP